MWQGAIRRACENREEILDNIESMLKEHRFTTSPYKTKVIYEPKRRDIYVLPFYPDRIVQHAVMNVLTPIWDNMMYFDSYACRKGKGQHKGSNRCMQFARRNSYCLKCDISKFYPSIHHDTLMRIIQKKIKDKDVINLLDDIVRSVGGERNVPIGNYTSQWLGNMYLNELDTFVKQKLRIKDYIRYCDDFILFGTKEELMAVIPALHDFVEHELKLKFSKFDLFPTKRGIDFLGYRHFPNGVVLLRKSTAKRVKKRLKGLVEKVRKGKVSRESAIGSIESTRGWLRWANTYNLRMSLELDRKENEIAEIF